jgi:hypothetical protein
LTAPLTTLLAAPFRITATQSIGVTDQHSTRVVTIAAQWYRTYLASASGTGTEASPREWLDYLADQINAGTSATRWSVTLTSAGLVLIAYSGTGTGTITWDGTSSTSTMVRNLCGFDANVSVTSAPAVVTATGTYHPTRCAFAFARPDDTGWMPTPAAMVAVTHGDGSVDALTDYRQIVRREFTVRFIPNTWADRSSGGATGTPAMPAETVALASLVTQPTPSVSVAPPYTWLQFLQDAAGVRIAYTFRFAEHIAASLTVYDVGYLAERSLMEPSQRLSVANWGALVDRANLGVTLVTREARS